MSLSGVIIGYDPGAKKAHGVAQLVVEAGNIVSVSTSTMDTTDAVIRHLQRTPEILAIGIDTLTCWSTGLGGWRPADRWLRKKYPSVAHSIVAPNSLRGAMAVGGMAVLIALCSERPGLFITETHPKVLFRALEKDNYDYANHRDLMNEALERHLGANVASANEHEWDAALSTLAALKGLSGEWTRDLHRIDKCECERIVEPCGMTHYYWPE